MTNRIEITTWQNDYEWCACFGDYDLGAKIGAGRTEAEAIIELIAQGEGDGRQSQEGRVSDRYGSCGNAPDDPTTGVARTAMRFLCGNEDCDKEIESGCYCSAKCAEQA